MDNDTTAAAPPWDDGQGWVKLHRSTLDSALFQHAGLYTLWGYCMLRANHKRCHASVKTGRGSTVVTLEPGQFIFGRHKAAEFLEIPDGTVRYRIAKLEEMGYLTRQTHAHFSVITVLNWEKDQANSLEVPTNHQATTNQPPTNHQASATDKKDNKAKNVKKETLTFASLSLKNGLVPSTFKEDVAFGESWDTWVQHRKEIKKPLTLSMVTAQFKEFTTIGVDRARAMISHTIFKGWQGLREEESYGTGSSGSQVGGSPARVRERPTIKPTILSAESLAASEPRPEDTHRDGTLFD